MPGDEEEGVTELGADEDGAVVEVDGQGLDGVGVPGLAPGDEAHGAGEAGDEGGVGVVTVTEGEGCAGGWTGLSWWPVSPRCRGIHSAFWGS